MFWLQLSGPEARRDLIPLRLKAGLGHVPMKRNHLRAERLRRREIRRARRGRGGRLWLYSCHLRGQD